MNRSLFDFDEQGAPIYKTAAETRPPLSFKVQKLWSETAFAKLNEAALVEDELPSDPAPDEELAHGELTQTQVVELKRDMANKLMLASGELENALHLINTILPFVPIPNELPPLFPLGQDAMAGSVLHAPLPPFSAENQLRDLSASLAIKSKAITDASKALLTASADLNQCAQRSASDFERYWEWQSQGWKLEARGADRTASYATAFERLAKDVVAVVSCDEAPPHIRQQSLAYLEPSNEGAQSKVVLVPRPLGQRRLKTSLIRSGETGEAFVRPAEGDLLADEQRAIFEEELFATISFEAQTQFAADEAPLRGSFTETQVIVSLPGSVQLRIEMVDANEEAPCSPTCQLIYAALSMRLLALYSSRRTQTQALSLPQSSSTKHVFLAPIIALATYFLHVRYLKRLLQAAQAHFEAAGLSMQLSTFIPLLEDGAVLVRHLLLDPDKSTKMGGHAMLQVQGSSLKLFFAMPSETSIQLPHRRLALSTKTQVEEVLAAQLAGLAQRAVQSGALLAPLPGAVGLEDGVRGIGHAHRSDRRLVIGYDWDQGLAGKKGSSEAWDRASGRTLVDWAAESLPST